MKCNNCGETLVPVFSEGPVGNQFIGALHLRLVPGYGEYFDGDHPVDIFICGGCTDKVLNGVLENVKEHIYDELEKQGF